MIFAAGKKQLLSSEMRHRFELHPHERIVYSILITIFFKLHI